MYSTQRNLTTRAPAPAAGSFIGRYVRYPRSDAERYAEGGLRTTGKFKQSLPQNPLVTVVTTVMNRGKTLERALCSVLMQTYTNIEYIIIDAGSTDNTLSLIDKYADAIDYFVSETDGGIYAGMNKGLELAQGDYVLLLNSDDWYLPECVALLVEEIRAKDLLFTSALAIEADEYGQEIRRIPKIPIQGIVRFRMPLRHETMLVSRGLYDRVGPYDDSYRIIADLKLTQDLHEETNRWSQIEDYVMAFRKTGVAATATPELIKERERLLRERYGFLSAEEASLLSSDTITDPAPYVATAERHRQETKFLEAMVAFLRLHGVFTKHPDVRLASVFNTADTAGVDVGR